MTRFASARHLASWAGQCPGNDQSAGKRRSGKTRDGSKWLDFALEEAAMAAIRVKANYPAAQYQRLKPRRGHKRALGAVKHTLICAIWHMLATGETYRDLGPDYFTNRDPERQTKRLVKQLERLGHHVTLRGGRGSLSELFLSGTRERGVSVAGTVAKDDTQERAEGLGPEPCLGKGAHARTRARLMDRTAPIA